MRFACVVIQCGQFQERSRMGGPIDPPGQSIQSYLYRTLHVAAMFGQYHQLSLGSGPRVGTLSIFHFSARYDSVRHSLHQIPVRTGPIPVSGE